jgi:hypothetical protein
VYIYICILLLFIIIDIIIIYFNVAYELISRKPPIGDGLYMKTLPPSGIAGVPPPLGQVSGIFSHGSGSSFGSWVD